MKKICLLDWYGHHALGDDLLHLCGKNIIARAAQKLGIIFEYSGPEEADLVIIGGGTILGNDSMNICETLSDRKAPLVIMGGGFRRDRSGILKKLSNLTGIGKNESMDIGSKNIDTTRSLIERSEYIGIRGYLSMQYFIHHGLPVEKIEVIGDLGFSFSPSETGALPGQFKTAVSVRSMGTTGEFQYGSNNENHRNIALICDRLIEKKNACLYFISFAENIQDSDTRGLREVITYMRNQVPDSQLMNFEENPKRVFSLLGQMSAIISQRLHPSLIGWTLGVPNVGLEYHYGKTEDFFGSIGMNEFVMRTDQFSLETYMKKLDKILTHRELLSRQSAQSINYWRRRQDAFAEKCLRLIQ